MTLDRFKVWRNTTLAGMLALMCFALLGWCYFHSVKIAKQQAGRDMAQNFSLRMVERFYESIGPVFMLATLVKENKGNLSDFEARAAELIHEFPMIKVLELAPGGVVSQVHPLRGNEIVIGHDLLKDKSRNKEAHQALVKRQMTVAGPVKLMQGGSAAIVRYPIFLNAPKGQSAFWGFSIALLNVSDLLAVAGEMKFHGAGYDYHLCRNSPDADVCEIFAKRGEAINEDPIVVKIGLPGANWVLTLVPQMEWVSMAVKISIIMAVLFASMIVAACVFFFSGRAQVPVSSAP